MSAELRLKKLRGSGGYVMATVNDQQQMKGNLGGADLFLAAIGRLDSQKITKYFCFHIYFYLPRCFNTQSYAILNFVKYV